jgi:hypothetical protein
MQDTMQRRHLALIDGIVAGEGNGPLAPRPAQCGTLVFGDNAVAVDLAAAYLMGFDAARIPILAQAAQPSDFALSDGLAALRQESVCFNGNPMPIAGLRPVLGRPFLPPKGWIGHVEAGGA